MAVVPYRVGMLDLVVIVFLSVCKIYHFTGFKFCWGLPSQPNHFNPTRKTKILRAVTRAGISNLEKVRPENVDFFPVIVKLCLNTSKLFRRNTSHLYGTNLLSRAHMDIQKLHYYH